ncbi:MAG: amidohydrolase [Thaumarchaeota archaeon]|nr:amidohydrolase [Nitrososphaerota archaeon]
MSIDVHVHPWTRAFMKKNGPIMKACGFFKLDVSKLPTSTEDLLEEMDEAKVSKAIILGQDAHATRNPHFKNYTMKNDALREISRNSRDRLVPFAGVDPNAGEAALRELKRAVNELGFKGLKVHSSANSVYPNDRRKMDPLCGFCEEAGVPILFHTGTTGLGDCDIKFSKPEHLDEVAQRFPDLKIVMAHFGWPWPDVAMAVALRNPNVYLDLSGWRPRYIPAGVLPYLNGILKDRFLFGTDYPMMRQKEWLDDFESSMKPRLRPGVAEKLLRGNARRLLSA